MCNVDVVNRISCFCLIIFLRGDWGAALATLATSWLRPWHRPSFQLCFCARQTYRPQLKWKTSPVQLSHPVTFCCWWGGACFRFLSRQMLWAVDQTSPKTGCYLRDPFTQANTH